MARSSEYLAAAALLLLLGGCPPQERRAPPADAAVVTGQARRSTAAASRPVERQPAASRPVERQPAASAKPKAAAADECPPVLGPPLSRRVPRGTGIETLARCQLFPFWVEVDQTHVYWNTGDGHLRRTLKRGEGQAEELHAKHSTTLVLDDRAIYFTGDGLWRMPKSGGTPVAVDKRQALSVITDGARLYYNVFQGRKLHASGKRGEGQRTLRSFAKSPVAFAADERFVYVVTYSRYGKLYRLPKAGGKAKVLAAGQPKPTGLAIDSKHVYWSLEGDGTIRRIAKRGGRSRKVVEGQDNHDILVGDERALYWASWGRGDEGHTLRELDKATLKVRTLASNLASPSGLALDPGHVYVANKGAGTVLKVSRARRAETR